MSDSPSSVKKECRNQLISEDDNTLIISLLQDELRTEKSKVQALENSLKDEQKKSMGLKVMLELAEGYKKENKLLRSKLRHYKTFIKEQNNVASPVSSPSLVKKNQKSQLEYNDNIMEESPFPKYNNENNNNLVESEVFTFQRSCLLDCQNDEIFPETKYSSIIQASIGHQKPEFKHEYCRPHDPISNKNVSCKECMKCIEKDIKIHRYEEKVMEYEDELTKAEWHLQEAIKEKQEISENFQIMKIQLDVYKSDFQTERADRENAMDRVANLEKQLRVLQTEEVKIDPLPFIPLQRNTFPLTRNPTLPPQNPIYTQQNSEEILIGRGANYAPRFSHTSNSNFHQKNNLTGDENQFAKKSKTSKVNAIAERESPLSNSFENLNLLPGDHGGDDFLS